MQIVIDIPEEIIKDAKDNPNYYPTYHFEKIWRAIVNGTSLTPKVLADLLMEERIRGELKQDVSYSKDVIDDVKCRLTVDIIDRRPCYCGAELRAVWRERKESEDEE